MKRTATIVLCLGLYACGLKGGLFLPPEPDPIPPAPAQDVNPPAEIEAEDEIRQSEPASP